MSQIILQPAGSAAARDHYADTITRPVPLALIAEYIPATDTAFLQTRYPEGAVPTWGVTPGDGGRNLARWEKVKPGDVMFFAGRGAVRATGVVTHKLRNLALAKQLWGTDADGDTWEFIYFVDQITPCEIPYARFNAAAGYKPNNVIQGFEVLDEAKSARILAALDFGLEQEALPGTEEDLVAAATLDPAQPLDAVGKTMIRKEQGFLRRYLFGRNAVGQCALCGEQYPTDLLIAAHVKKRSLCSHDEKLDYRNNVVAMCKMGCDDLFERGYLCVTDGVVGINSRKETGLTPALRMRIANIAGRHLALPSASSASYFAWHKEHHS